MNATDNATTTMTMTNNDDITMMLFIGLGICIITFCCWMICRHICKSKETTGIESKPEKNNRRGSRITFVI